MRRLGRWVGLFRLVGKTAALEHSERILPKQGLRYGLSAACDNLLIRSAKLQRAAFHIMRIAGDKMNAVVVEPLFRASLRR